MKIPTTATILVCTFGIILIIALIAFRVRVSPRLSLNREDFTASKCYDCENESKLLYPSSCYDCEAQMKGGDMVGWQSALNYQLEMGGGRPKIYAGL
jgi:hypothetical protein